MPTLQLAGNSNAWIRTGFAVRSGEWLRVRASGRISFAVGGWMRDPDGRDEHGRIEAPARNHDSQHGVHPAGDFAKNSLVVRIGDRIFQGGSGAEIRAPQDGEVLLAVNDNYPGDNGGSWRVDLDTVKGDFLHQRVLVVLQGSRLPADPPPRPDAVLRAVEEFRTFVWTESHRRVAVHVTPVRIPDEVDMSEYTHFNDPRFVTGSVAFYSRPLHAELQKRGIDPRGFDVVLRIYDHPLTVLPRTFFNTWRHYNEALQSGPPSRPGYSGVPGQPMLANPDGGFAVLVHEYLHQIDHRFEEVGLDTFPNPDGRGKDGMPATPNNLVYYQMLLHRTLLGQQTPWSLLHGTCGQMGP